MGLFEQVLGSVIGGATKGGSSASNPLAQMLGTVGGGNASQGQKVLSSVMSMVQQQGGLVDVLGKFSQNGMKKEADSWVGTGPNIPISQDQVQKVFGASALKNVASQIGLPQQETGSAIAKLLPELINQLTPKGNVPNNHKDLFAQGLSILQGSKG